MIETHNAPTAHDRAEANTVKTQAKPLLTTTPPARANTEQPQALKEKEPAPTPETTPIVATPNEPPPAQINVLTADKSQQSTTLSEQNGAPHVPLAIAGGPSDAHHTLPNVHLPTPGNAADGHTQEDLSGYTQGIMRRVEAVKHYPNSALRLGLEGVVKVMVHIGRDGQALHAPKIQQSSGHQVLDDEALRMVRVTLPFAPLPAHIQKPSIQLIIPIAFKIEDSSE